MKLPVVPLLLALAGGVAPAADRTSSRMEAADVVGRSRQMSLSGKWDAAVAMLKSEIAGAHRRSDRHSEAAFRVELGRVLADRNFFHHKDPGAALAALNDALRFSRESGNPRGEADAAQSLGQLHYSEAFKSHDWVTPRAEFQKVIEVRQGLGDRRGLAESYFYLGLTWEQDGKPAEAMQNYRQSLSVSEELGDRVLQSYAHRHIGGLNEERGELEAAERAISRSVELRRQAGFTVGVPFALMQKADFMEKHRGDDEQAGRLLREAVSVAQRSRSTRALSAARSELARLALKGNRVREALSHAERARDSARQFGDADLVKDVEKQISEIRLRILRGEAVPARAASSNCATNAPPRRAAGRTRISL